MYLHQIIPASLLISAVSSVAVLQQPIQNSLDESNAIRTLYEEVGNRLTQTSPIGKPCYPPTFPIRQECRFVSENKLDDTWTTNQPGGHFYSNWASCQATDQTCLIPWNNSESLQPNAICHQGSVPDLMIQVESQKDFAKDVNAAFKFVKLTKRPFVIRNTGHDWKGRSNAPRALALWTHKMQAPNIDIVIKTNYTPDGCEADGTNETVLSFGAGSQWGGLYAFAEKNGLAVLGGTCPSVGVAGWLQGGGHSPMTPRFGMGVDNVRQLEIVTPANGTVIANRCKNSELFYAMRGGGGGTFGVITNITYKAVERVRVQDFSFQFQNLNNDTMKQYFQILANNSVKWSQQGWGGYLMSNKTGFNGLFFNSLVTKELATQQMEPLINFINATKLQDPTLPIWYKQADRDSWFDCLKAQYSVHASHWSMNPASRLLGKEHFNGTNGTTLVNAFLSLYHDNVNMALMFVAPTRFNQTLESPLHPTWKRAVVQIRAFDKWIQYDDRLHNISARSHFEKMRDSFSVIREHAPEMGISISEADIWETNPNAHFWGCKNYDRLLKLKKQVDPENLLTNYGAIDWDEQNARYKCYPKKPYEPTR